MGRSFVFAALIAFAASGHFFGTAKAAELPVLQRAPVAVAPAITHCGCRCGCLAVTYVRHRQLAMTYGPYLDPRERDEPRYYWGPVKRFARYQTVYPIQAAD